MLHIDRNDEPAPACLSDSRSQRARDVLRDAFSSDVDIVSQTRFEMHGHAVTDHDLQAALERLFHGRCALCERAVPTYPYRFRPTEEAGPTSDAHPDHGTRAHLYYTWLTNSWDNIYPLCDGCTPKERSVFPVRGHRCALPARRDIETYAERPTGTWRFRSDEKPLLLDPCVDEDFRKHLLVLPDGRMFGIDDRARFTVRHFDLDRSDVQAARRKAFKGYFRRLIAPDRKAGDGLFAFEALVHGGTWFLLLYQLAKKLGAAAGTRPVLTRMKIEAYYATQLQDPDFRDDLQSAFDDLNVNFGQLLEPSARAPLPSNTAPRPVRFHIQNVKSIENLEINLPHQPDWLGPDEPQGGALIILGENAVGKSSILEAIALALAPDAARHDLSLDAARFMLAPRLMGANGRNRRGNVEVAYEEGPPETLRVEPGWPRGMRHGSDIPRLPVFAYGAFRMFLRSQKRGRASSAIRSLFEPNHELPNPERWLASLHGTPAFTEVVRALRSILAIDQTFDVIEADENGEFCLSLSTELPNGEISRIQTPLTAVSSGFRSVLGMACDVMRGLLDAQGSRSASLARARALVLIDEVEAHLHPRWKMRIMTGLRQSLPNVTFIVTTHDPLCLRGMATHEVLVLRRARRILTEPGECPEFVEKLTDLPPIDTLTIEQLLTSDLFQLFSTDARDMEDSLAHAGDLLALERAARVSDLDAGKLAELRIKLHTQIARSVPIGSTQVERLIQEAVEEYLIRRRATLAGELANLRQDTKNSIIAALERL